MRHASAAGRTFAPWLGGRLGVDHSLVLSPSWPVPERLPRRLSSPQVRRRVAAAQRRGLRLAVMLGGALIAAIVAVDALHSVIALGPAGRRMALVQLPELVVVGGIVWLAGRRVGSVEVLAMALVALVFGVTLARLWILPGTAVASVSYLSIILVGSGLFLPWTSRWHAAWLGVAFAAVLGLVLLAPGATAAAGSRSLLVAVIGFAALVSFFGHRLWQVRLRNMLEQQFALRELSRYARRQEANVTELNRELNRVARRDPLTGVGNRLALDEALGRLLDQGDRLRPQRFALALFDIDHFKPYNDEHGHLIGDAALARLGQILRRAVRDSDLAFRYGGEEFLLLLPGVDLPEAIGVAERVRVAVADDRRSEVPPFTVSGGVALCDPADGRDPAPLLRRADVALYQAKRAGRDRIAADQLSVAMQRETLQSAG